MEKTVLGQRIRSLREEKGLSQIDLAKKLNVKNSTLCQYESGARVPSDVVKHLIANYFGVTIDYLLGRTNIRNSESEIKDPVNANEAQDILETLHKRPEMKALFKITKNASKDDIEKAVRIIEALKGE